MADSQTGTPKTQNANQQLLTLPGFSQYNGQVELEKRRPWWRRPGPIIFLVILLLALLIIGYVISQAGRKAPVVYQYGTVSQGDISQTINATGPIQSGTYNLSPTGTATKINEIDVKVGQKVKKGWVLARLDKTALQDAVDQAQASVDADQSNLNNATGDAAIAQAQGQLDVANKQLDAAKHNLDTATLIAPHDGVVTAINGNVGGTAGAGGSGSASGGTGTTSASGSFIQLVDLSGLQVQANVNESDTANVKKGDPVTFTVNAYGDREFKGKVNSISPAGVSSANVVTYPVTIDVDMDSAKNANLFPNMTANVTVTVLQHKNVETVPVTAINFSHTASTTGASGQPVVTAQDVASAQKQAQNMLASLPQDQKDNATTDYVVENAHGKTTVKPVVLGINDGTNAEVLKGLDANESVVTGIQGSATASPSATSSSGGSNR